MITCYFDEAGGKDQEFVVVAGWASTVEQWERFAIDWRLMLAKHGVPYLHMKEYSASKGSYRKWKGQEGTRAAFLRDSADVISSLAQAGFVVFVAYQTFDLVNEKYELAEKFNSPYALAGRTCVLMANTWRAKQEVQPLDMRYVFEDGGMDKQGLSKSMRVVKPYLPDPIYESSRDVKPSSKWPYGRKGIIQLQAADYLAYEIRKFIADHPRLRSGERTFRKSLGALPGDRVGRFFIDSRKLVNLCELLHVKRRTST